MQIVNMEAQLIRELRRRQIASATELQQALGISQPTLSRLIGKLPEQVTSIGQARATRYALLRHIRNLGAEFPIFQVSEAGQLIDLGMLKSIEGGRWHVRDPILCADRLFDGLPYFLSDSRPQGFMGRAFPAQHANLLLPERIADWSDDDAMVAIAHCGKDAIGNLIVGAASVKEYIADLTRPIQAIANAECASAYSRLAKAALHGDPAGSSAGGEQPKFAATIIDGAAMRHVLVKFSPGDDSPASQRWRDLLVAEHLASISLSRMSPSISGSVSAVDSRLIEADSRIFLEVTRFDRIGERGRVGIVSLGAVDDDFYGRRDNWLSAADRLERDRWLSTPDAEALRITYAFGGLIANTDRHFGNISFVVGSGGGLSLSPAYDQLPMLYAPSSGQLVERQFVIEHPQANALNAWKVALPLAENFWEQVIEHPLISQSFKEIAKQNALLLRDQARLIANILPEVLPVIETGEFSGAILQVANGVVVQKIGRDPDKVMRHDAMKLSRFPLEGEVVNIKYRKGVGEVSERGVGVAQER